MAENPAKPKRRGGFLAALVICVLLVVVGFQLMSLRDRIAAAEAERSALAAQVAQQEQENRSLEAALQRADDPAYLQELARKQLGMVSPGQKDFYDISN